MSPCAQEGPGEMKGAPFAEGVGQTGEGWVNKFHCGRVPLKTYSSLPPLPCPPPNAYLAPH